MRRSRKASRNEALVATVSLRALKSRLPDLASLDHQGMRPQRKDMRIRSARRSSAGPAAGPCSGGRAVPDPEHRVGRGDVPARGVLAVGALGQGGPEVAGDPGRGGVESEASAHAGCIVTQQGPVGGVQASDLGVWLPERAAHGLG